MKKIEHAYINGAFVKPQGTQVMDLINPSNREAIGQVTLGDERDARSAIAAAKDAFRTFSKTTVEERGEMLQRLYEAVAARKDDMTKATVEEYGASVNLSAGRSQLTADTFLMLKEELAQYSFERRIGKTKIVHEPVGVAGLITPWNSSPSMIAMKVATALAAGCTMVLKPSEISAIQTQVLAECIHEAGIPAGVINIVNGLGETVGTELTRNPDVAIISFTGSSAIGKIIYRSTVDTLKRVVLELGGKSPNILLDDADFDRAIPQAVMQCFGNNGQMCIAGSRLIVPESRLEEVKIKLKTAVEVTKVGNPWERDTVIGPMASEKQYNNIQRYIKLGLEEGAELVTGGEGHPFGLEGGYYVKPTVFSNVTMDMAIAQEEIFGPVISILTYRTEEEAIEIANQTCYGLSAYISTTDLEKAGRLAGRIESGMVSINGEAFEMRAPFGGRKQSGLGREFGAYGMDEYMEIKSIIGLGA